MSGWYLNRALTNFRNEVNKKWPNRDKSSDGTIGDARHQASNSDHNPDPDGSVDAWDMDNDGVDINACKRAFEKHPASKYWIYNDMISFRSEGWKPRSYAYAGPNRSRHTEHVHWNTREEYEDSNLPWFTEDEMELTDQVTLSDFPDVTYKNKTMSVAGILASTNYYVLQTRNQQTEQYNELKNEISAVMTKVDSLMTTPPGTVVISDEQLERVLTKVLGSLDN